MNLTYKKLSLVFLHSTFSIERNTVLVLEPAGIHLLIDRSFKCSEECLYYSFDYISNVCGWKKKVLVPLNNNIFFVAGKL